MCLGRRSNVGKLGVRDMEVPVLTTENSPRLALEEEALPYYPYCCSKGGGSATRGGGKFCCVSVSGSQSMSLSDISSKNISSGVTTGLRFKYLCLTVGRLEW